MRCSMKKVPFTTKKQKVKQVFTTDKFNFLQTRVWHWMASQWSFHVFSTSQPSFIFYQRTNSYESNKLVKMQDQWNWTWKHYPFQNKKNRAVHRLSSHMAWSPEGHWRGSERTEENQWQCWGLVFRWWGRNTWQMDELGWRVSGMVGFHREQRWHLATVLWHSDHLSHRVIRWLGWILLLLRKWRREDRLSELRGMSLKF